MDGLILIDKPAGVTSHDVVARVRREVVGPERSRKGVGKVRVGHSGTLDPFATGLLVLLLGRATRVQAHVMALPKRYVATARFGFTSTTGDPEGQIVETGRVPVEPLALPTGTVRQRPPAFSAVHVDGKRAYDLARAGVDIELPERDVLVHRFDRTGPDRFEIECSAGTYVRTLIADLGDAYCTALRRTAVGPFLIAEASADPVAEQLIGLGEALERFLPVIELAGQDARRAAHGLPVAGRSPGPTVVLRDAHGPIALAEPRPDGMLKPVVGFRA
ncbi:MAG: tRNA pseudouridine(55) synthase TruB [Actinomycetota bacterium]|nr:tRNA pseudouridine(55) synthase TruB [Actinomycetota bacterium]